jgi:hypothetical protein
VKELAGEMVAVFRSQNVAREALAALLTFQTAAFMDRATISLAQEIAAALVRTRGKFPPSSNPLMP